ncbi:RNA polymerase sigma factor [Rhodococcus sp. HNM0569]|uniref:RNA polymerase sigma factor n=1 Tax=Rhodococcus sp. HNM0569 TaxID=2716340 RepID=UPI00146CF4AE|nr:RNA polymerase sigma factor [Rhodococcus sp. HNM0569]NLU82475.1 RNA polymerase sigma factor [Rhodococcus sp. HNM0569]
MNMKPPFEHVVAEHSATVLRMTRAVLGSQADAEDAWSETFLAALRAYPDLPDDANVQAWLVTIAKHKAVDAARAGARRPVPVDVERTATEPEARESATTDGDVWDAVARLPERQRLAVAYRYFGGLPYQDIADTIGGNAAAARRAAADGLAALRVHYGVLAGAQDKNRKNQEVTP